MTTAADDAKTPTERALALTHQLIGAIPHNQALGMKLVHTARGTAILRLPYSGKLIGNPETGVIHGGVVTTLIDSCCGLATITAPDEPSRIVTLDLRIDYLRPATPGRDLIARAEVYKLTRTIAFLRAEAYEDDPHNLVAAASATFMFVRNARRKTAKPAPAPGGGGTGGAGEGAGA
jgi:uncharacterized protein (TIGR00369 family)